MNNPKVQKIKNKPRRIIHNKMLRVDFEFGLKTSSVGEILVLEMGIGESVSMSSFSICFNKMSINK